MSVLGKWRIIELPGYEADYADMVELAYILFNANGGEFAFGCVTGAFAVGGGHAAIEFDWNGNDEMDEARGSGWAELQADDSLRKLDSTTVTKFPSSLTAGRLLQQPASGTRVWISLNCHIDEYRF